MPANNRPVEFVLNIGQQFKVEDRWDPLPYTVYFSVSRTTEFSHAFEHPPWSFRNRVAAGRHQIFLPPGYNKLVFRGLVNGTIVRYRIP